MKKSLISLAVATAAFGSANAAEVYSLDGVTVDISGEVEVNYFKSQTKSLDAELRVAEANFGFDLDYEMTEDFAIGGHVDFDAGDDNDGDDDSDDVTRGDVYISFIFSEMHTFTAGSQPTILDDAGIGEDFELGFTSYVTNLQASGDQVFKYKYDGGETFYAGISYSDFKNDDDYDSGDYQADANIGMRMEDIELTMFVVDAELDGVDENAYSFEARYTLGDLLFGATYAMSEAQEEGEADIDIDMFGLTASYWDGGRFTYAIGWANIDNSSEADAINDIYANVNFDFSDQVNGYMEIGITDEDNTDIGYVVGISASF